MDIEPCKQLSREVVRESLIEISYCIPADKSTDSDARPEMCNGEVGVDVKDDDGAEKYRSELISISYNLPIDVAL